MIFPLSYARFVCLSGGGGGVVSSWAGEVIGMKEGRIHVQWSDNTVSVVWPTEVMAVDEEGVGEEGEEEDEDDDSGEEEEEASAGKQDLLLSCF